jgi:hypothetical protein
MPDRVILRFPHDTYGCAAFGDMLQVQQAELPTAVLLTECL